MADGLEKEKEKQQAFLWDRSSSDYADYFSLLMYFQVQSVLEHCHGGSLLDLACGDGSITALLAPKFETIVGVDASAKHLEKAKSHCPHGIFCESLIEDFETDERFDVVTLICLLEHVIDPVLTLKKTASFLKDDGILIVHVPNALGVNRKIACLMGTLKDEYELSPFDINVVGHRRSYDMDLLTRDFLQAGLRVSLTGGVFYKMLSTPQMDFLLKQGPWENGGFGWGRVGSAKQDWRFEFANACYEYGKSRPDDCNVIYAIGRKA